jgi:hypothetical protein
LKLVSNVPATTTSRCTIGWTTIPITWRNRRTGEAKLKIKEMGSRYLFICMYVWLEKYFSRGDYRKRDVEVCEQGSGGVSHPAEEKFPRAEIR